MDLIKCPHCEHEILSRIGTICPNCGHTVTYFEGNKKKARYGKFFAISVIIPFISFLTILSTSLSKISLIIGAIIYILLALFSCPIRFKDLFFTTYEKVFFWGIWLLANSMLTAMVVNLFSKLQ